MDVVEIKKRNLSESQRVAVSSLEAWLEQWLARALPIYISAFHAFMGIVREKKNGNDDIVVEASIFYEALMISREFTTNTNHLDILCELVVPIPVSDEIKAHVYMIDAVLSDIESRCISVDGVMCVATEDLVDLVKVIVKAISEVGRELSHLVESFIQPFNEFMQDFDKSIAIDYVDGIYHLLLNQEYEELDEKVRRLEREKQRLLNRPFPLAKVANVYVITDKGDLVDYIQNRWNDQVVLTKQAQESLVESGFKNIKKLVSLFDILAEEFYPVYECGGRMDLAVSKLESINAEFKPKLSEKTKGRHLVFDREYKGRLADLDRHICLGTSRDKQHCFRLHFEFDEDDTVLVVHHAGDHLPMADD